MANIESKASAQCAVDPSPALELCWDHDHAAACGAVSIDNATLRLILDPHVLVLAVRHRDSDGFVSSSLRGILNAV